MPGQLPDREQYLLSLLQEMHTHWPQNRTINSENSETGAARFADEVLTHRPDVVTIDYALNDRGIGLARAEQAWRTMIEQALGRNVKVILLTPTMIY